MELKTYGDLKKVIKLISLKQKGEKILSQGKEVALDQLLGLIPGASNAKSAFNFLSAAFKKPDTVKTNTWLDKLDIDDKMSAIVDDTVENGFLQFLSKTLEAAPDEKPLQLDFNMNQQMADYLKKTYSGRHVAGLQESTNYNKRKMKKVLITESQLRAMVRKMLMEQTPMGATPVGSTGFGTPPGVKPKPPLSTPPGVKPKPPLSTPPGVKPKPPLSTPPGVNPKPPITTPQQMQQSMQQRDQAIETSMLTALQRDTALLGRLKTVTNFSQADTLIKTILGITKIPQAQIKSGLANLSRIGVQTQAGR